MRRLPRVYVCVLVAFFVPGLGHAQVTPLDSNYTTTLLASGLTFPEGVVYRPATRDFLVPQTTLGQIAKVDGATGTVSPFATVPAGTQGTRDAILSGPLAINSKGEVFVPVYASAGPVLRYDSNGNFLGSFTVAGVPIGVAFDRNDNFLVSTGGTIYEYPPGTFSTPSVFASGLGLITALAINASGQIFAADYSAGNIYQIVPGGTTSDSHVLWASGLSQVLAIAVDPHDQSLIEGSYLNGVLNRVSSPGVVSQFASGFDDPQAFGFDTAGNLFVADAISGIIWKFTQNFPAVVPTISPNHGGNSGTVTVLISSQGVVNGATAALKDSGTDIVGMNTGLLYPGILGATFDLTNTAPGIRDVVLNNPDGTSITLPGAFTVLQGGVPQLWAELIGPSRLRVDTPQTYYISYGNRGTSDALGIRLIAYVPSSVSSSLTLGNSNGVTTRLTQGSTTIMTIFLGRVPAGSTSLIPITLTASPSQPPFQIQINISGH